MRIIPKRTKVKIEFFKGIEVLDVIVGGIGAAAAIAVFVSNLPYRIYVMAAIVLLTAGLLMPMDDDNKSYMFIYIFLKHMARYKKFQRRKAPAAAAPAPAPAADGKSHQKSDQKAAKKSGGKNGKKAASSKKGGLFGKKSGKAPEAPAGEAAEQAPEESAADYPAQPLPEEAYDGVFPEEAEVSEASEQEIAPPVTLSRSSAAPAKKPAKKSGILPNSKPDTEPTVEGITPFTGIDGCFIEYGGEYYGIAVSVPSVEFRFLTEMRQNNVIDRMLGGVLRTISGDEAGAFVKIDRPVIYDSFIENEYRKLEEVKEAYRNDLFSDEELTTRVAIIYDRINEIQKLNFRDKVYRPFHYIMFFDRDKAILRDQAQLTISNLQGAGMDCALLEGAELAVFLKYQYTALFDEREALELEPEAYMDWILPQKIEFASRTVKYDDVITHNLRLTDYPMMVSNAWGHQLFNIMNTRVVMKFRPVERYKSVKRIDRAIDELRGQLENTGKASRIIELESHINTLSELLTLLQGDNEVLFDTNTYVSIFDYEQSDRVKNPQNYVGKPAQATSLKKQIRRQLQEGSFRSTDMFLEQFDAYVSAIPSRLDMFRSYSRGIHSGSIAAAFPYVYTALSDPGGFMIGNSDGIPAMVNFFTRDRERVNSNMVIIGKSGSGKSYATKTLLANLAAEDSKIFILDPENEYSLLCKNLCGKLIDVGSATQGRLNPFHIITSLDDGEESDGLDNLMDDLDFDSRQGNTSYNTHLQFLEEFFRVILPGINSDSMEYLNNLLIWVYSQRGIDMDTDLSQLGPEDYPTFDDLYDKILNDYQMATGDYSKNNLRILLNYISKFATGGRNAVLWNGPSSVSTDENMVVFNFQSLLANKNNTIANAQMMLVMKYLDNEIIKNRDYNLKFGTNRKIIVVIDEAHVFIDDKYPVALDFMFQMAKRIRKYSGMQIVITQNIKDFVGSEELARKSTAIINASQYSLIFSLAPNDMTDLCTLYEKAGAINETEQDEIVNNGRGRAFVITSPSNRTCIDITATPEVREMFTMGVN